MIGEVENVVTIDAKITIIEENERENNNDIEINISNGLVMWMSVSGGGARNFLKSGQNINFK
jgi:hypothetical protein